MPNRTTEDILLNDKLFRVILENSVESFNLMDGKGTILFTSPATFHLMGYEPEKQVGRNIFEFVHPDYLEWSKQRFAQFLSEGHGAKMIIAAPCRHKDGSWLWIEGSAINLLKDPEVGAIVTNFRNITALKKSEEEINRKNIYLNLLNTLLLSISEAGNIEEAILVCLEEICKKMNWSAGHAFLVSKEHRGELLSTTLWHISCSPHHLEWLKAVRQSANPGPVADVPRQVLSSRKPVIENNLKNHPAYTLFPEESPVCTSVAFPVMAGHEVWAVFEFFSGKEVEADKILTDLLENAGIQIGQVFERRRAEAQMKFQNSVINNIEDSVIGADIQGRITYWNRGAEKLYGYTAGEVIGKTGKEIFKYRYLGDAHDHMVTSTLLSTGFWQGDHIHCRKNGEEIIVTCSVNLVKNKKGVPLGTLMIIQNVTEKKRTEELIRRSEERYRLLFESNPMPMLVVDRQTLDILAVNEAAIRHYGYSEREFLLMNFMDLRLPEDIPALKIINNIARNLDGIIHAGIWKHRKKDGSLIDVEMITHSINFEGKQSDLVLCNDVTVKKKAEEEVLQNERKYRSLIEGLGNCLIYIDTNHTVRYCNERLLEFSGYLKTETEGRSVGELFQGFTGNITETGVMKNAWLVKKGGSTIHTQIHSIPSFREKKQISGFWLVIEPLH